jgi:hypothetical protein
MGVFKNAGEQSYQPVHPSYQNAGCGTPYPRKKNPKESITIKSKIREWKTVHRNYPNIIKSPFRKSLATKRKEHNQ